MRYPSPFLHSEIVVCAISVDKYLVFITAGRGAIYTRWGRKDCPGNVSMEIYSGNQIINVYTLVIVNM